MSQLGLDLGTTARRRMPSEPIMRSALIEDGYRWTMTRGWDSGPCILWALLNPSDADGKRDDPTTLRMMGFSYRWGFGSMIVVNVYPFISSTTDKLRSAFHHNQGVISKLLSPETVCVAAWGNGVDAADLDHFLHGISFSVDDEEFGTVRIDPEWKCLGRTANRSPIHPLARGRHRVSDDAKLKIWKKSQALQPEKNDY